jgi:hypothetical protein
MTGPIQQYLAVQPLERQAVLAQLHSIILEEDKTVAASLEPMMGKEMILYKHKDQMKYGLAGMKNYMTLHVMPIYGSPPLFAKYKKLLDQATFQKGCINFESADKISLDIIRQMIADCAGIDLLKIREAYLQGKKKSKK